MKTHSTFAVERLFTSRSGETCRDFATWMRDLVGAGEGRTETANLKLAELETECLLTRLGASSDALAREAEG